MHFLVYNDEFVLTFFQWRSQLWTYGGALVAHELIVMVRENFILPPLFSNILALSYNYSEIIVKYQKDLSFFYSDYLIF